MPFKSPLHSTALHHSLLPGAEMPDPDVTYRRIFNQDQFRLDCNLQNLKQTAFPHPFHHSSSQTHWSPTLFHLLHIMCAHPEGEGTIERCCTLLKIFWSAGKSRKSASAVLVSFQRLRTPLTVMSCAGRALLEAWTHICHCDILRRKIYSQMLKIVGT